MERTKKVEKKAVEEVVAGGEPIYRWKKLGGGSFRMPNRIIKPGEIFEAPMSAIPEGFRDVIVPLDSIPEGVAPRPVISKTTEYSIVKREKGNWYDVTDDKGKQINEKALSKVDAEKLVDSLS